MENNRQTGRRKPVNERPNTQRKPRQENGQNTSAQKKSSRRSNASSNTSNTNKPNPNKSNKNGGSNRNNTNKNKQKSSSQIRIIPLGGLDAIGKNMTVIESNGEMVLIDAGLMFPDDAHFGVDIILPDYSYVIENKDKLRGIIITHGHEDHTGALPYLLKDLDMPELPILGTKMTLGLISGKLEEHKLRKVKFREIQTGGHATLGSFGADFFAVNHSIPGAVGVFLRTPGGTVLHTGDFKLDQTPIDGQITDYGALARFGHLGVDLMLSDSTNATNPNFTRSEADVGIALREIIGNAKQRVIVASFASHIHRIQQVCDAAVASGRKVVVTGRSMVTNTKIARELGYLNINENDIVDAFDAKDIASEKVVVLCTGSQGEPLSALARMANRSHRTVEVEEGDTVIISATPVPGNEKAVIKITNELSKIGAKVYDKSKALVHVSGHAGAEELKIMINLVQPKHFMPVHGEAMHLMAHADLAERVGIDRKNIFVLTNGDSLFMRGGEVRQGESVPVGEIYVDGLSVGDVGHTTLQDREKLSNDGIATVVVAVSRKNGRPVGDVELAVRGIVGTDEDFIREAKARVKKTLEKTAVSNPPNIASIKNAIKESLSGLLWERIRRRPEVVPVVMEV